MALEAPDPRPQNPAPRVTVASLWLPHRAGWLCSPLGWATSLKEKKTGFFWVAKAERGLAWSLML